MIPDQDDEFLNYGAQELPAPSCNFLHKRLLSFKCAAQSVMFKQTLLDPLHPSMMGIVGPIKFMMGDSKFNDGI